LRRYAPAWSGALLRWPVITLCGPRSLLPYLADILAVGLFMLQTAEARLAVGLTILLIGVIVIALPQPWALGMCRHHAAACHRTFFSTAAVGGGLMITGAWIAWLSRSKHGSDN
jgi:hypothetical protein